jgi:acetate kinase
MAGREGMNILVLNGGSSSFKCWYGDVSEPLPVEAPRPKWEAHLDWSRGKDTADIDRLLHSLSLPVDVVGHRIVHGGRMYRDTTRITPEVRAAIAQQVEFAPSHNRLELEAIQAVDRVFGAGVPQVAVFDTAFHASLDPAAFVYPGPYEWLEQWVRRFGFHGISHHYASRRAAHLLNRPVESLRIVTCHLGNGASLAAIRGGRSIDTTMGFTPLEGIMMGTRSGSVDPGILIYLLRHRGYTADELDRVLNQESGLRGVSGLSGDMREIQDAMAQGNKRAQLAFDVYLHRLRGGIGSMVASLGGMDALVFTGGIGENSAPLREKVAAQFAFLDLKIDNAKNAASPVDQDIATAGSKTRVLVIRAEEDWEIARECYRLQKDAR